MRSYDVTNLFTNIPLNEPINIAIVVSTKPLETHFVFDNKFYDGIDDVTMGPP